VFRPLDVSPNQVVLLNGQINLRKRTFLCVSSRWRERRYSNLIYGDSQARIRNSSSLRDLKVVAAAVEWHLFMIVEVFILICVLRLRADYKK
jgi:hypothetical protein